jgi:hypothetical protein
MPMPVREPRLLLEPRLALALEPARVKCLRPLRDRKYLDRK